MLVCDLREYQCPQLFVQFKVGLNKALLTKQSIKFMINNKQSIRDIQRFLEKHQYHFEIDLELEILKVELM
ncbi:sulfurtransferase TusA family protein [Pseudoalteromonas mariniglutinosa]